MNHIDAGELWNCNAEAWTTLARAGFDYYRDLLNTPAFFQNLPAVQGLYGLDVGCGDGHNTRLLAEKGATMEAIDISENFIRRAKEIDSPVHFQVASAVDLPFEAERFDFVTGFMSFMDVPETELVLREAFRVLKKGGFLQFSITHPCFDTPHRKNKRNEAGKTYAVEIGDYFQKIDGRIDEWIFGSAPIEAKMNFPKFKTPRFHKTLSEWLNLIMEAGFVIEHLHEPRPTDEQVAQYPHLQDSQVVAYFLHIRCRKLL